jgi:hypothetical protein
MASHLATEQSASTPCADAQNKRRLFVRQLKRGLARLRYVIRRQRYVLDCFGAAFLVYLGVVIVVVVCVERRLGRR